VRQKVVLMVRSDRSWARGICSASNADVWLTARRTIAQVAERVKIGEGARGQEELRERGISRGIYRGQRGADGGKERGMGSTDAKGKGKCGGRSFQTSSIVNDSTTLAAHAGSVRDCRLYRGSNATVQLMCLHHRYPRVCLYVGCKTWQSPHTHTTINTVTAIHEFTWRV
jgi:hypothetical protein